MTSSDTREKLAPRTVLLHWVIALAIIGQLAYGLYIANLGEALDADPKNAALKADFGWNIGIHKSVGMLILLFALWRLTWRMRQGLPQSVGHFSPWERMLHRSTVMFLLFATFAMPITGILTSVEGAHAIAVFGLPVVPQLLGEANKPMADFAEQTHGWLAYILIGFIALHLLGVLKHHVIDKDGTLRRMLGARVEVR